MSVGRTQLGCITVSRFILGSNPFSGYSHQSIERDQAMRHYYSSLRIKETLRLAESLGIDTLFARADHHVMRLLMEYQDEGGTLQWVAQTCSELGTIAQGVRNAIAGGAAGCYLHGGQMDNRVANRQFQEIFEAVDLLRDAGLAVGVAGHKPQTIAWAAENLDVDFFMCSYYNPTSRDTNPSHVAGANEWFHDDDRDLMTDVIAGLNKPAVHYKVLAAGRNAPREAFSFVARHLRPQDAVCVGVFLKDDPGILADDVALLDEYLARSITG